MRKLLVPIAIVLSVTALVLALTVDRASQAPTLKFTVVSGQSVGRVHVGDVTTTTAVAHVTTTSVPPVPMPVPTTTTVPKAAVHAATTTTQGIKTSGFSTVPPVVTTATTTTTSDVGVLMQTISATSEVSATNVITAPDHYACSPSSILTCVLLTATVNGIDMVGMGVGDITFDIYGNTGGVVPFVTKIGGGQTWCLISLYVIRGAQIASSPDCSVSGLSTVNNPVSSEFQFSATFAQVGWATLSTGRISTETP